MSKNMVSLIFVFLAVVLIFTSTATASGGLADSSQPKFKHDNQNTGQSPYHGPQTNHTNWTYLAGDAVTTTPTIASDGTIYFGSADNNVYALDPDGNLKWIYTTGDYIGTSPTVAADGTIYVGSDMFYALDSDGNLKWSYETGSEILGDVIWSSPAVADDGTIYFGSDKFYALDTDGNLKWTYDIGEMIYSSPAISSDGTVYFGSNMFYALSPEGELEWAFKTNDYVDSSPAIDAHGTIYFGSEDGIFYALNSLGDLIWTYYTGGAIFSSPSIGSDGTIYFGSEDGFFYALDQSGNLKWNYNTGSVIDSSPAVDIDGTVYFGSVDGFFYALDKLGNIKWTFTTESDVGDAAIGDEGTLYFGNSNYASYYGSIVAINDLKPDLIVENISGPSTGEPGGKISVSSTIKNQGTLTAYNTSVKFYLTPIPNLSGTKYYLGERLITSLGPGETNTQKTMLTIPTNVPEGNYFIAAVLNNFKEGYSTLKIKITDERRENSKYSVSAATIGMQPTGTNLLILLVAAFMVAGGIIESKKK